MLIMINGYVNTTLKPCLPYSNEGGTVYRAYREVIIHYNSIMCSQRWRRFTKPKSI